MTGLTVQISTACNCYQSELKRKYPIILREGYDWRGAAYAHLLRFIVFPFPDDHN